MALPSKDIPEFHARLKDKVTVARTTGQPLLIQGSNSKSFYGRHCVGEPVDMTACSGVIHYDPTELVITAHAGTSIKEMEETLAREGQMLPFEPPCISETATLGGIVATGLSGPRRPYTGSVRDYILGTRCLTGWGEILKFGGEVMKNVAGYDVSRLMTGAMGTLGIILDVSLKVLPQPKFELALCKTMTITEAMNVMCEFTGKSLCISGAAYQDGLVRFRLSGKQVAVEKAWKSLGMQEDRDGLDYWQGLRNHTLDFFNREKGSNLWRLSVPANTSAMDIQGDLLIDWGGAQRWYYSEQPAEDIWQIAESIGGHATLFRRSNNAKEVFQPLSPVMHKLHQQLKQAFDPDRIMNRGRMYADF
jgi:glycolate oxidase FAD binding subunit